MGIPILGHLLKPPFLSEILSFQSSLAALSTMRNGECEGGKIFFQHRLMGETVASFLKPQIAGETWTSQKIEILLLIYETSNDFGHMWQLNAIELD